MRVGMMLSMPGDPAGTREISGRAVRAEQAGFASAWLPQVATVDALMALALAGAAPSRIALGTAGAPAPPRPPPRCSQPSPSPRRPPRGTASPWA